MMFAITLTSLALISFFLSGEAVAGNTGSPPSYGGGGGNPPANDIEVLNYALTLEHLEYAFYRDGIAILQKKLLRR